MNNLGRVVKESLCNWLNEITYVTLTILTTSTHHPIVSSDAGEMPQANLPTSLEQTMYRLAIGVLVSPPLF